MQFSSIYRIILVLILLSYFDSSASKNLEQSGKTKPTITGNTASKTTRQSFEKWKFNLKPDMLEQGAKTELVDKIIDSLTYIPRVIKLDRHQPEGRMTQEEYLAKVIPPSKIKRARQEYKKNFIKLKAAEKLTGVQARFIVSLWGKETNFGTITGNYSVPSSLATLAYDGRRAKFFRKELMAAVKILAQGHIELENMKGSWAGAMGNCQFMPSSFLQSAVDANHDGKKDIWGDKDDIFASMGNYLARYGWDKNKTWGRQVSLTGNFERYSIGKKHIQKLSVWQTLGVRRMDGSALPNVEINAYLIAPDGKKGRIYLVYPNFDIIMRWNRSYYFATGVGYLADRITFPSID